MFNHQKSVDYGFSLFSLLIGFVFVGKLASAGAVFRTIILWRWKFRALPQSIFGKREVRAAGSISILIIGFWGLNCRYS
ncbi:hypothetical protein V9N58_003465 [Vibrio cholerae]|uniref:hypothetical protein n=1 Tax=Vibrio cholerae TaxID=666 RepID=UPI000E6BB838|nr:hypothetical protein [Vibrio cholerae]EGQ8673305.1 hypothetical protein [Vibrio cholerae]EGR2320847.1 hypothetical protein [Vibrio cholerae]EJL7947160.1 hypothetical protein [Vibrio cholerae]EJL7968355.1 hypothetical protein [Vibrio cholerae]EKF9674545.1 hypothetical protein [Vibrio cholerae]